MTVTWRRRWLAAGLVTMLSANVAGAQTADPDPLQQSNADVAAAQAALDDVQRRQAELQAALDAAVVGYESAQAQLGGLDATVAQAEGELSQARAAAADATAALAAFARRAYITPDAMLIDWVVSADDVGDSVHRAVAIRHVLLSGQARARQVVEAEQQARRKADLVAGIQAGTTASAEDLATRRGELDALLSQAAALEAEALATLEAAQVRAVAVAVRFAAPPLVDGRACPVQRPYSFIDSWGAPRSGGRRHKGVDVFAPEGNELYALADGVIARTSYQNLGGITLHLREAATGDVYFYAHLSDYAAGITPGTEVAAGDVVGYVGRTGNAIRTPPHLHLEHHPGGGAAVNPTPLALALCGAAAV